MIYRYDNKGNVIVDNTTAKDTLGYDQLNRLIMINPDDTGFTKYYYYDGEGKRIRTDYATDHFIFLYDQWGNLICERDPEGNYMYDYVWTNGKLIAKIYIKSEAEPTGGEGEGMELEGGGPPPIPPDLDRVYYYHLDHLGTPLVLTGTNRGLCWGTNYLPFGKTYDETSLSVYNEVRFPGQYHDRNTGLYYNWHRYYNPSLGRYYQADPIGQEGGINLYHYVKNNPVRFVDPLGLQCEEKDKCADINWWEKLERGYYYGTGFGEEALQYYADLWVNENASLYVQAGELFGPLYGPIYVKGGALLGGLFAALWVPETWYKTSTTLISGYGLRNAGIVWSLRDGTPARTIIDYGNLLRVEKHLIGRGTQRALLWHVDALCGVIRHWPWGF